MRIVLLSVTAAVVIGSCPRATEAADVPADPRITGCVVTAKADVAVPAQDAGVLVSLDVTEGETVRKGYLLAKIDDTEPVIKKELAEFEKETAEQQAKNDINVRYAKAQADHARASYQEKVAANNKVPGAITQEELRTVELDWKRTMLSIEQAEFEMQLAVITAKAKAAAVTMEEKNIERRKIKAPIDGVVVSLNKHDGEWVSPGDTILRLIDLATLRVEGFLNAAQYNPSEVIGRPVTVDVNLARGSQARFEGKVTFVSPNVETGGEYAVWAEIKNRKEKDGRQWVLPSGLTGQMVIHVSRATDAGKLPVGSKGKSRRPVSTSRSSRSRAAGR